MRAHWRPALPLGLGRRCRSSGSDSGGYRQAQGSGRSSKPGAVNDGKLEPRLLDMILNLVAARMVEQYEFDAKRWGKGLAAVAVEP